MKEPCSLIDSDRSISRNAECINGIKRQKDPLQANLMKEFSFWDHFGSNLANLGKLI